MQLALELLAPARNLAIGTAAIDCGADAVYIAGPSFGARVAAANPIEDVAALCRYAHIFGARVYATLNTLIEKDELPMAEKLIWQYYQAGVDALIVQDMSILSLNLPPIEMHASTQAVVRSKERAVELEKAGFSRIILERQMSIEQIRDIRKEVNCEMEFFVHGALCVCYSGQCYLSEHITGRSANKGCCAQPCRSRYDLCDADGHFIAKDQPLLSLKDFRLDSHIARLALEGIKSFKIEGRLKNASYVKNIVRHYSRVLDEFIAANPQYCRASFGRAQGGFEANPDATFNRGYTSAWIDGKRGHWKSEDAAKSLGEYIGQVESVKGKTISLNLQKGKTLANGDGLSIIAGDDEISGMRVEVASGREILVKDASSIEKGAKVYRSLNLKFERELEKNMPRRLISAQIDYRSFEGITTLRAVDESGACVTLEFEDNASAAEKPDKAEASLRNQLSKISEPFSFSLGTIECDTLRFYPASQINAWRRELSARLMEKDRRPEQKVFKGIPQGLSLPENIKAGEGELMRMKYCIKWELGLCPKQGAAKVKEPLQLINRNQKFYLHFDCKNCEMTVSL